ncbi:MAG: hypothetical protein U0841_27910 [Chloroflexia bacterium]
MWPCPRPPARQTITADGEGQTLEFTVAADAIRDGRALVTLRSATWN